MPGAVRKSTLRTSTLQQLNERIVTRNEQEALQQRIDRSIERKAKKQRVNNIEVRADKLMKKKSPAKPIYNRKDLTPERYIQHSQEEGKTDREIREMYDIPSGSFTKIKKDLLALIEGPPKNVPDSDEPDNDVALLQKVSKLETEYGTAVNQLEQAKQEIKELQQQIVAVNNQLTQEQQYNNELKAMVDYLENKNANESHSTTTSDAAVQDYKALYEQAQNALLNSEKVANDRLQTIEGLEKKITEIIFSTNKQNSKVQDYEIILLERLLQALYANRN